MCHILKLVNPMNQTDEIDEIDRIDEHQKARPDPKTD